MWGYLVERILSRSHVRFLLEVWKPDTAVTLCGNWKWVSVFLISAMKTESPDVMQAPSPWESSEAVIMSTGETVQAGLARLPKGGALLFLLFSLGIGLAHSGDMQSTTIAEGFSFSIQTVTTVGYGNWPFPGANYDNRGSFELREYSIGVMIFGHPCSRLCSE